MSKHEKKLADFGAVVLEIMETDEWDADMTMRIADEAFSRGLAKDKDGFTAVRNSIKR